MPVKERRLIVLNRILNDDEGRISLHLLRDAALMASLNLAEEEYAQELRAGLQERFSLVHGHAAERFTEALGLLDALTRNFRDERVRRASISQGYIAELQMARAALKVMAGNEQIPELLRRNCRAALALEAYDVFEQKILAERLHRIRFCTWALLQGQRLSNQTLQCTLPTVGQYFRALYLHGCHLLDENVIATVIQHCPHLEALHIEDVNFNKISKRFGDYIFPHLRELYLYNLPQLQRLEIIAPNLRVLHAVNCPQLTILSTHNGEQGDEGVNSHRIIGCPKLVTEFELPSMCYGDLRYDFMVFQQCTEIDTAELLRLTHDEVSRGNYGRMLCAAAETTGEARLTAFDEHLHRELGIESQYLRHYTALLLIQGAGEGIPGARKDLNFSFNAARLITYRLWEYFRRSNPALPDRPFISGISNLMPRIIYNPHEQSVTLEFDDIFSIRDDSGKNIPACFANYAITIFADRSRFPEIRQPHLAVYNNTALCAALSSVDLLSGSAEAGLDLARCFAEHPCRFQIGYDFATNLFHSLILANPIPTGQNRELAKQLFVRIENYNDIIRRKLAPPLRGNFSIDHIANEAAWDAVFLSLGVSIRFIQGIKALEHSILQRKGADFFNGVNINVNLFELEDKLLQASIGFIHAHIYDLFIREQTTGLNRGNIRLDPARWEEFNQRCVRAFSILQHCITTVPIFFSDRLIIDAWNRDLQRFRYAPYNLPVEVVRFFSRCMLYYHQAQEQPEALADSYCAILELMHGTQTQIARQTRISPAATVQLLNLHQEFVVITFREMLEANMRTVMSLSEKRGSKHIVLYLFSYGCGELEHWCADPDQATRDMAELLTLDYHLADKRFLPYLVFVVAGIINCNREEIIRHLSPEQQERLIELLSLHRFHDTTYLVQRCCVTACPRIAMNIPLIINTVERELAALSADYQGMDGALFQNRIFNLKLQIALAEIYMRDTHDEPGMVWILAIKDRLLTMQRVKIFIGALGCLPPDDPEELFRILIEHGNSDLAVARCIGHIPVPHRYAVIAWAVSNCRVHPANQALVLNLYRDFILPNMLMHQPPERTVCHRLLAHLIQHGDYVVVSHYLHNLLQLALTEGDVRVIVHEAIGFLKPNFSDTAVAIIGQLGTHAYVKQPRYNYYISHEMLIDWLRKGQIDLIEKYLYLVPEQENIEAITPELRTELTCLLTAIQHNPHNHQIVDRLVRLHANIRQWYLGLCARQGIAAIGGDEISAFYITFIIRLYEDQGHHPITPETIAALHAAYEHLSSMEQFTEKGLCLIAISSTIETILDTGGLCEAKERLADLLVELPVDVMQFIR